MVSLTWNRANLYAQGLAEDTQSGVTSLGTELLSIMDELGIVLDLTHLSQSSFWSALKNFKGPVMASHSNAIAVCPHPRNLTDDQIRAVVERGGLIGLNLVPRFVGGDNLLEGIVRHAEYIRNLVGLQCLALGPDFINYLPAVKEPPQQLLASDDPSEAQSEQGLMSPSCRRCGKHSAGATGRRKRHLRSLPRTRSSSSGRRCQHPIDK